MTLKSGELVGFWIQGHSDYAEEGSDIVCAAVSSAAYMTANTILEVLGISADVTAEDGDMRLRVSPKDAALCRTLFAGLKLHLIGLEEQYPTNIDVSYTEV